MASLTFSPSEISKTIYISRASAGLRSQLPSARACAQPHASGLLAVSIPAWVSGTPAFEGDATLSSDQTWCSVPATCQDGSAFAVNLDPAELNIIGRCPRRVTATVTASKDGYDGATLAVVVDLLQE